MIGYNSVIKGRKGKRMSTDLLLWVIRAVLIVVGIIAAIMVWKGKKEGRFQERYYISFLVIGITASVLGVILLILSFITDISFDTGLFLIVAGAIGLLMSFIIRNRWKKKH
jgi:peptidoglycan/LPS O-acetylase OafA/YrhL